MSQGKPISFTLLDQNTLHFFQFCRQLQESKKHLSSKYRNKLVETLDKYYNFLEKKALKGIPEPHKFNPPNA